MFIFNVNLQSIAGLAHLFTVRAKVGKAVNVSFNVFLYFALLYIHFVTHIATPALVRSHYERLDLFLQRWIFFFEFHDSCKENATIFELLVV